MNSITASLLVSACVFSGGLAGWYFHRRLPAAHLTKETQEVIRLSTGMLSVLASLVPGLLIASAKTNYDTTDRSIRAYAAELALLNEVLRDYGQAASTPRDLLRAYIEKLLRDGWPVDGTTLSGEDAEKTAAFGNDKSRAAFGDAESRAAFGDDESRVLLEHVREAIRALRPVDDGQRALRDEATDIDINVLRQRWLLVEQQSSDVQTVVLVILVSWVTVIFASFGINAPRNTTVLAAYLVGALAIGGAVFLIMEMDRPLDGVMRISSWPVRRVLAETNW